MASRNFEAVAIKKLQEILADKGYTAEMVFEKYDADGNGSLDLQEFRTALSAITGQSAPEPIIRAVFGVLDGDNNGSLELAELYALIDRGDSPVAEGEVGGIQISGHSNPAYNGSYSRQSDLINGMPWFKKSNGNRMYFTNANTSASSWNLDDREQDGHNDWYRGGWTRASGGKIPIGTRRWVGVGQLTISMTGDEPTVSPSEASDENTSAIRLEIAKSNFYSNEEIVLDFTVPEMSHDAWIGVIPAEIPHGDEAVNDEHDVSYKYLQGATIGEFSFPNPGLGDWTIRLHDKDEGGSELAYVEFNVVPLLAPVESLNENFSEENFVSDIALRVEAVANNPELTIQEARQVADFHVEERIQKLPFFMQASARNIWAEKAEEMVLATRAHIPEAADLAKGAAVAGLVGGTTAAIVANSTSIDMQTPQEAAVDAVIRNVADRTVETAVGEIRGSAESRYQSSQEWHDTHKVETPSQESSSEWHNEHHVETPDRVNVPDRVSVPDSPEVYSRSKSRQEVTGSSVSSSVISETPDPSTSVVSEASSLDLSQVSTILNEARFLNDQQAIIAETEGKETSVMLQVEKIERTFSIGLDDAYRGGQTVIGKIDGVGEVEIHLKPDYDVSDIRSHSELAIVVSVHKWNGIRKRLELNAQ
ncbi:MAG: hypothetical protein CND29_00680 [Marine Group II euryarchaeote MED-G36]|nr:MAG: hypothetical protein CND29_00680 [Marine Group II euryarchaeote MED-G36]